MEEKIGVVTDYLDQIGVAVIHLTDGDLNVGDQVHISGRTTEATVSLANYRGKRPLFLSNVSRDLLPDRM